MAETKEDRIKKMRESIDKLSKEYDVKDKPKKKSKKKVKSKKKKGSGWNPFSAVGLAGKIKDRKAANRAAAKQ